MNTATLQRKRIAVTIRLAVASIAAGTAVAQPFTVNTASREEVRVFFNTVYRSGEVRGPVALDWTGSIAACNPGTIAQSIKDQAQLRLNYYRAMAGMPANVTLTPELNATAQAGAFLMSANKDGNHEPPPTWNCYTAQGAEGAKSNLRVVGDTAVGGAKAIDTWLCDCGLGNEAVGHRRWILFPPQLTMGYGEVPATTNGGYPTAAALYVFGGRAPQAPVLRDGFVAWPPKGFVPVDVVNSRWSFSIPGADFANATVTMTRNGAAVPTTIQDRGARAFGDPTLVWAPAGMDSLIRVTADEVYVVTINNVTVGGAPRDFNYSVTLFDPAVPGPDFMPPVVTGPDRPPLNQATPYNFTAVPGATGYQWRSTKLTPLSLIDGAEAGLANFTTNLQGAYNPVDTATKASGTASFRLKPTFSYQTLTFNRTLLANENSQITFKSRFEDIKSQIARVEVSTDGGGNWLAAFTQIGTPTREGVFSDKLVPLGAYAGRQIQVRFSLQYPGEGISFCCDPLGWYIDDITFVNLDEPSIPVIGNVAAGTSFAFTPTEQAEFALDVRAQFYGQYYREWGIVKRVSTVSTVPTAPIISTQPSAQTVAAGATVTFAVAAQGTAPLAYVWRRNGTDLTDGAGVAGSRTAQLTLQNVQAASAGSYTVQVGNGAGNVTSTPAVLVVNEPPSLGSALDTDGMTWIVAGNANWFAQTTNTQDGVDAAQSGRITDNQESRLEVAVTGPATVAFWWRVDSEPNYDFLRVDLDGTQQFRITGTVNWEQKTIAVAAGAHTLRWAYTKDGSESRGADAAWVDRVEVRQTGSEPQTPPPPSLAQALNATNVTWAASGDRPWFAQTTTSRDGSAVQSGPIGDSQASRLEATILGPANLSFWWKVDSEATYDFLRFELDNVQHANAPEISGNVDWQSKTVPIPAGTHLIRWSYTKDGSANGGADAGWVDQVVLTRLTPGEGDEPGPKLEFTASGTKLRLTWPEVADSFRLQVATSLASADWIDVPENDISKEQGEFFVIVNTAAGTKFYRLVEP